MKNTNLLRQTILISIVVFLSSSVVCMSQNPVAIKTTDDVKTIKKGRYTLVFECKDPSFNQAISQKLIDTYFKVYPKLVKKYNKKATKSVIFVIDPVYTGVAGTSNGKIVFSSKYMTSHPTDIDIVTHETMHIVQSYGGRSGMPGWLTEGIADYVRFASGVDNAGGGWSLPKFSEKHSYKNSYRITARFLAWLEDSGHKGIVKKLDQAGRDKTYENGAIWANLTGKTIDALWADYSKNPSLPNVN
jgi:hypothetical protein